jgi:hypothetical protein
MFCNRLITTALMSPASEIHKAAQKTYKLLQFSHRNLCLTTRLISRIQSATTFKPSLPPYISWASDSDCLLGPSGSTPTGSMRLLIDCSPFFAFFVIVEIKVSTPINNFISSGYKSVQYCKNTQAEYKTSKGTLLVSYQNKLYFLLSRLPNIWLPIPAHTPAPLGNAD